MLNADINFNDETEESQ